MTRIYNSCREAISEELRNLKELGIDVNIKTYQDKNVENDLDFLTKEIIGETFTITDTSDFEQMHEYAKDKLNIDFNKEWADAEFEERISEEKVNPGEAYKKRPEVWNQFITNSGVFHYTYNERLRAWKHVIINELKRDKGTRRAYLPIFDNSADAKNLLRGGRISCSLGYQFLIRNVDGKEKLHMIYMIRSSDALTHWINDVYLAIKFQRWIAKQLNIEPGHFTMFISSFHGYMKDLKKYNIF